MGTYYHRICAVQQYKKGGIKMQNTKKTYISFEERAEKIDKLTDSMIELQNQCNWDGYLRFKQLPERKRKEIELAWDEYYRECQKTPAAKLYREMMKAVKERNKPRVEELQTYLERMKKGEFIIQIKEPLYPDARLSIFSVLDDMGRRLSKLRGSFAKEKEDRSSFDDAQSFNGGSL